MAGVALLVIVLTIAGDVLLRDSFPAPRTPDCLVPLVAVHAVDAVPQLEEGNTVQVAGAEMTIETVWMILSLLHSNDPILDWQMTMNTLGQSVLHRILQKKSFLRIIFITK